MHDTGKGREEGEGGNHRLLGNDSCHVKSGLRLNESMEGEVA